jgi:uncharacterized protein YndB with AHSA1/START domain
MTKPAFVYTTYIETSAEQLWQALTDGDFTERYWLGHRVTSDWTVGSAYRFTNQGKPMVEGKVLVSDPPRRLTYSWDVVKAGAARERTSRVTFDLTPRGKVIKLVVTHDEIDESGTTLRDVSAGWPMVLASLKSILETGHALDIEPAAAKELAHA